MFAHEEKNVGTSDPMKQIKTSVTHSYKPILQNKNKPGFNAVPLYGDGLNTFIVIL